MKKLKIFFTALMTLLSAVAFAQKISVKGSVTDAATGEGIPFATLIEKGTTNGSVTDANGDYTFSVGNNGVIVFSSIGYKSKEVGVNGQAIINVTLEQDSEMLNETIVVAFGTTTKEAFTGSAAVVRSDDLEKRQTTNVANALVGSVPGLQMKGASGQPGAAEGSISIRGISSLYSGTEPLVIVDGSPYPASLSNIPQQDIESISVLKDAASAALYGARGAAGVIIVTTKRNNKGNATVTFDAKAGVNSRAIPDYETINDPAQFYEAYYTQLFNSSFYGSHENVATAHQYANNKMIADLGYNIYTVPEGELLIGLNGKINPNATLGRKIKNAAGEDRYLTNDDWTKEAYRNSMRQEYNLSVNGGTDKASFYASIGYLKDDGIIQYTDFQRITARIKADYQAKKWLKFGANVSYVNTNQNQNPGLSSSSEDLGSTNLLYYTSMIAPIYPVYVRGYDENGNVTILTNSQGQQIYDYGTTADTYYGLKRAFLNTGNPLGKNRYDKLNSKGNQINGTFTAEVAFTPWLRLNINSNVLFGQTSAFQYENMYEGPKAGVNGQITKSTSNSLRTNNIQTLTFDKVFGKHSVNAMIGHEYYNQTSSFLQAAAQGLYSNEILEINAAATKMQDSKSYTTAYNVEGFFVSAQYNFDSRYYLSASYRRDASSMFEKKHRWGNFWSVGGAWILSKEKFMSGSGNWLDILKIKASVGQQGNDNTSSFAYTDLYTLSKANETQMSAAYAQKGNPELTWETTTNTNAGIEFSLWKGRLSGEVNYYNKATRNLLFWLSIPESCGARGYYGNIGKINNSGVELVLNGSIIRNRNFEWTANLNLSSNNAKVVSLPESKITENGGFTETNLWYKEGGPLINYFTYSYAGVSATGEALYYYDPELSTLGGNSTNNISRPGKVKDSKYVTTKRGEASRYESGDVMPKVFGGFGTGFRFYGVDISVTFDYQLGGMVYDSRYAALMAPTMTASDAGKTFHKDILKSWNPNNTESNIPRFQYGDQYSAMASDRFLTSASYLNFQSFSIGYTFPAKWFKNKCNLRIYALGENLLMFSSRKGFDPRQSYVSSAYLNSYSPVRTISGGIQVKF